MNESEETRVSDQPYADAVAALLDQGYQLEEITLPEVVHQALDRWLRQQVEHAISMHAAGGGSGHQPEDHCESWYALQDALTQMHAASRRFVMELLAPEGTP